MAGRHASEQVVIKPYTDEESRRWPELEGERRRERRARAEARRARPNAGFDGLAIGAPLTAAFVGMLLAEGYIASDAGAAPQEGVAAARGGAQGVHLDGDGASRTGGEAQPGGEAAGAEAGGPDGGAAAFQPSPSGADVAAADEASAATGLRIPDEASGGAPVEAAGAGGIDLSLTFARFGGMEAGLVDEGAAGSSGVNSIGKHVVGTDGDDVIYGTEHDDHLYGGAGDDTIYGLGGDDLLDGGIGNDRLYGGAGDDRLYGGAGEDRLHGGEGNDLLDGGAGHDRLFGNEGRDSLFGGIGNDHLDGGPGADRTQGGAGSDTHLIDNIHDVALENARGADGGGLDTLRVGDGFAASLEGAYGDDAATFVLHDRVDEALPGGAAPHRRQVDPDIENVLLTGSAGHDVIGSGAGNTITGNGGDNALFGMGGDDILAGGAGQDRLEGGAGEDRLQGDAGNDILAGGSGEDDLYGGSGDDVLAGGDGADRLFGQAGNDSFHLGVNDSGVDTVFDHEGVNGVVIEGGQGHLVETGVDGDNLGIVVDKNLVAEVEGWAGNEGALSGIDSGSGSVAISDLMAENADKGSAGTDPAPEEASPTQVWAGDDLLGDFLSRPSLTGGAGRDTLSGTSGSDWLAGLDGDDHLHGAAGSDVLEGGGGNNLMEGGAGDDRYLFRPEDSGLSTIRDAAGSNVAELDGFTGARLEGRVVGRDLYVVADQAPLFVVEGFVGNEGSFAGIQNGDSFVATEDLLA